MHSILQNIANGIASWHFKFQRNSLCYILFGTILSIIISLWLFECSQFDKTLLFSHLTISNWTTIPKRLFCCFFFAPFCRLKHIFVSPKRERLLTRTFSMHYFSLTESKNGNVQQNKTGKFAIFCVSNKMIKNIFLRFEFFFLIFCTRGTKYAAISTVSNSLSMHFHSHTIHTNAHIVYFRF